MKEALSLAIKPRESFPTRTRVIAYDPGFDRSAYKNLSRESSQLGDQEYMQRKNNLNTYTKRQLETFIGERLNVGLSKIKYEIKEGRLFGENMDDPMLEVLERGRDYRRRYGDVIDFVREEAEVIGFGKVQETLCDPKAEIGNMLLSVSLPGDKGSIYKHNFYDIFTLLQNDDGRRFVEARRYSSALSREDYIEKLQEIGGDKSLHVFPSSASFLANPIKIDKSNFLLKNADDIHRFLHRKHDYMFYEQFQEIIEMCLPAILFYLDILANHPDDERSLVIAFQAVQNFADELAGLREKSNLGKIVNFDARYKERKEPTKEELFFLGKQPVREVVTPCGSSGGSLASSESLLNKNSVFGVSEFGLLEDDKFGSRTFKCPDCQKVNTRQKDQLIRECQHCKSKKVAC